MKPFNRERAQIAAFLVALFLPSCAAAAQTAQTVSLTEQLRAQYKVAKIGQQDNSVKVLDPGTVLIIQKGGIIPVPYSSAAVCSARYQDGKLDSPDALCPPTAKNSSPFKIGEKVYPVQIDVDLKKEKVSFRILACDTCNGTSRATSSKSEVIFQFAPGYLERASVLEVEDTIGDVLAIDDSSAPLSAQPAPQPEDSDPNLLTNDKVIKMASVKLGDAVILGKIKTSQCNFDTSTDALIKLKQAGVSDTVLQAMIEAGAQSNRSASGEAASDTAQSEDFSGLYYMQETGSQLQLNHDGSFSMWASNGRVSPGRFTVNAGTLALTYDATGRSSLFRIQGNKFYSNTGAAWIRQGDAPAAEQPSTPDAAPTQTTFSVRHRHISLLGAGSDAVYYCSGDLSVLADGTVKYDCTQTDDPSGRCEHVSIPPGLLKQAKVGYNGLHLATKAQGNFDFSAADAATLQQALTAVTPLIGTAPAASTTAAAPAPPPAASNCSDYEACMKKGEASLQQSQAGAEALAEFEKASQLDPSKSEPLTGKGYAYLQMAEYEHAAYMWDSALKLGATLSIPVCHAGMACGETGDFLLSTKEVSFVTKKGEKKLAAAPSAVASEVGSPKVLFGNGQIAAYYVQLKLSGKNYRFYYGPKGAGCKDNFMCSEPGLTQQKVVAEYVQNTLDKMRAGSFGSQLTKP